VRVGIVEAVSGAVRWVDLSRDPYEYIARVKWLPDSRRLSIQTLNRDQTVLDLVLFDRDGKRLRRLLRETEAAWINVHDDLWFLERSERFLWASERSGHMHLYLYDLEGKLQGAVTQGDWALRSSSSSVFWMRQAVQAIDEDKGHVWFTALEKSPLEKHLYRVGLDGSGLERVTRADGTHRVSMRADGKYYLDDYSNLSTPPSLTLRSARAERLKWIAAPQGDLGGRFHTAERQLLTIPAADGFPLPAHVMRRRDLDLGERHPLILRVYGGPSAPLVSNSWEAAKYFDEILAHRGYVVVRVDNRSATAISKRLESAILHEGYGPGELRDLVAAVRWLKEQPWVDPERVGLWGWSGGGTFTLLAMTGSEEFRAGISVAPVTDWRYYDTLWAERFMKRPQDNAEGYAKVSLVKKAKDLHGRLLLVHGTHDDNVHLQHTWHFVDELIRARKLFDLMIYPTRKHSIGDDPARIHLYKTMLEFWQKNL
jgi:dipeptidyl-peptidase-4